MQITDPDILNFALNLEYLEAEFYVCATTGMGIPSALRGGGPASIGCEMANLTGNVKVRFLMSGGDDQLIVRFSFIYGCASYMCHFKELTTNKLPVYFFQDIGDGNLILVAPSPLQIIAEEIAADELAHVVYLRAALGAAAVAMPLVRLNYVLHNRHGPIKDSV